MLPLKLKLFRQPDNGAPSPNADTAEPDASSPATSSAALKVKFKPFGKPTQPPPAAEQLTPDAEPPVKQKRKYTKKPKIDENGQPIVPPPKAAPKGKKRAREEVDGESSPVAKRKIKSPTENLFVPNDATSIITPPLAPKIKLKTRASTGNVALKVKYHGKPPIRNPGVGYDSEAEDAEIDPAIESQFILRMRPGPDCDTLRQAITEKRVGRPDRESGLGVQFRFFDKEGRRTMVTINKRMYAAMMVDLPCVIESMKSWNKRDWVKSADVCQMLLVLGQVKNEDEAKNFPVPKEVDPISHQFAHGLTPPMHWVRRRRFRQRVSFRKIEQVEAEVERLRALDKEAEASGGYTKFEILDPDHLDGSDSSEEDEGEYGEEDIEGYYEEDNEDEMAKLMEQELGGDDDGLFGELAHPATAHDVAMNALGSDNTNTTHNNTGTMPATETPGSTSNAETDDDADDDVDIESEQEIDEDALAEQRERDEKREEIEEIENSIKVQQEMHDNSRNILMKQRILKKIGELKTDLNLKKKGLGDEV
ncbi:hypothetical protein K432DRAFT_382128, partial [Lepidopterella palustris CBS 459.81]